MDEDESVEGGTDASMYWIKDYNKRYKPTNKSGGELKNADYVKLPVKPKGDGLQVLLQYKRGLEVFGIWCLLLEKTTQQSPENRGKLLNHQDKPATIAEISQSISLKGKEKLVGYAINVLLTMSWIESNAVAEISSENFRNRAPKLSKDKLSKDNNNTPPISPPEKQKYLDFVFLTEDEHKKLTEKLGPGTTKKYIERLNNYIGSKGKRYKSHYHTILNWSSKDNEQGRADREDAEKTEPFIR